MILLRGIRRPLLSRIFYVATCGLLVAGCSQGGNNEKSDNGTASDADTDSARADTDSTLSDTESALADTESTRTDTESTRTDTESARTDTASTRTDTESVLTDTESAGTDTESQSDTQPDSDADSGTETDGDTDTNVDTGEEEAVRLEMNDGDLSGVEIPAIDYEKALAYSFMFYEANSAGKKQDWNRVEWRGDSVLNDGQADFGVDLSGGWFDAGDYMKFNLPMSYSARMLMWSYYANKEVYVSTGQEQALLNNVKWVLDYLVACHISENEYVHQIGDGVLDHSIDGTNAENVEELCAESGGRPAFSVNLDKPGATVVADASATLALASIVYDNEDYLSHARQLYQLSQDMIAAYPPESLGEAYFFTGPAFNYDEGYAGEGPEAGKYYNSFNGAYDELAISAVWLYEATGDPKYLIEAEDHFGQYKDTVAKDDFDTPNWTLSWCDKQYSAALKLYELTGKDLYKNYLESTFDFWFSDDEKIRSAWIIPLPGGLRVLVSDTNWQEWGTNRYAANTAWLMLEYSRLTTAQEQKDRLRNFAVNQIAYILGDNPDGFSYMIGFGDSYPLNPHHRGAYGARFLEAPPEKVAEHILYGAVVGGQQKDGTYNDVVSDYAANEVATDYNAGFTAALAEIIRLKEAQ